MNFSENVRRLIDLKNPPELTLRRRPSTLGLSELRATEAWKAGENNESMRGLLLLWQDHWPESHAIAQAHEGVRDFDFLHALGHRREGDFSNASYWFGEAGDHPAYGVLSNEVREKFGTDAGLIRTLVPSGQWNPEGFVRLVKKDPSSAILRSIQALEFRCFFDYLLSESP